MVTDGSHYSPPAAASGQAYITVRDIKEDAIDFENCAFVDEPAYQALCRNGCNPKIGDVLFSKDGTVGKVALVDSRENFVVLWSLAIIRSKSTQVHAAYLAYVLRSPAFLDAAIGHKTGVAIRRIILKNLKQIPVPHPSLPEQRRIVAILGEAFEGIATAKANAEKNLQSVRDLVDFGYRAITQRYDRANWPVETVARLAADHKGAMRTGPFGSQLLHGEFVEDGIAVLGIDNAVASEFRWDRRRYITPLEVRATVSLSSAAGRRVDHHHGHLRTLRRRARRHAGCHQHQAPVLHFAGQNHVHARVPAWLIPA